MVYTVRLVSQKRDLSVDFDRCEIWTQNNVIYRRVGNDSIPIGVYATQERAKEVFEDIHKAYAPVYSISDKLTEEEIAAMIIPSKNVLAKNITNAGMDMCLTTYDNYVYYMPEK